MKRKTLLNHLVKRILNGIWLLAFVGLTACTSSKKPIYKDANAPADQRAVDLLKRMTLEEKVAQLYAFNSDDTMQWDAQGNFNPGADSTVLYHGVGTYYPRNRKKMTKDAAYIAQCNNSLQKYLVEKTRLGIPAFMFSESLHGFMAKGATSFPQAIAMGCTWDTVLVEQLFNMAALEARTRGTTQVLSPVLDLARDPRWGRTEECYGEDPYLVSRIALAAVQGLQGRGSAIDSHHVAVTLKHFAGHGQPEGGRNIAPVNISEREFRESHLYPFEIAVKRGHAQSIMASYNDWDGIPNHVNKKLLVDILRKEWGFNGFVMSDGGGMDVLYWHHLVVATPDEAGALSIENGLDYDLGSNGCFANMANLVKSGKVSEQALDRAVSNILRVKFVCGLFDNPYANVELMQKVTNSPEHKALALKAAHEALVLLKNDNRILPFDSAKIKTLAVIGPNAAGIHLGGYTNPPNTGIGVLEGLKAFAGNKIKVMYAEGCGLTLNKECHWLVGQPPVLSDPKKDEQLIQQAVQVARQADAVVLVLGENELLDREAWNDEHLGDTDDLGLVGQQQKLAEAILKTGKPVVILLINGRPLAIRPLTKIAPVILECWYAGQETGHAVADVLFGKVNPSGKLSVTYPNSVGQLPDFYDHKPSRFRHYLLDTTDYLFPFGYGLSYTTFSYSNINLSVDSIPTNGQVNASVEVTNSGSKTGVEIVQLYIHDVVSFPTRPVKELKDFARVSLEPGETKTVSFTLTPDKLEYAGFDPAKRVVQPGDFAVMIGTNSDSYLSDTLKVY